MERIHLICIGLGNQFNNFHVNAIADYRQYLGTVTLFDIDSEKLIRAKENIGKILLDYSISINVAESLSSLFNHASDSADAINIYIISVPLPAHYDLLIRAVEKKCFIYVDKPFVENKSQAKHIILESKKTGSLIVVGSQRRFETIYSKILLTITKIGLIKHMFFYNHGQFKNFSAQSIENDVFVGVGYHIIDTIVWLIENSKGKIIKFHLAGSIAQYWDVNPGFFGAFHTLIVFSTEKNVIPVTVSVSNLSLRDTVRESLAITGTAGEISLSRVAVPRDQIPGQVDFYYWNEKENEVIVQRLNGNDSYDRSAPLKQLFNYLLGKEVSALESTAEKSLLTVEIIEAIKNSAQVI